MKKYFFYILTVIVFTHSALTAQWVKTTFPKNTFSHSITYGKGDTLFVFIDGVGNFFRSTDNGNNWQNIYSHVPAKTILGAISYCGSYLVASLYDPFNLDSTKGVYLSTDNGDHWQIASGNGSTFGSATLFVNFGSYLLAAYGSGGLMRSSDCGNNWLGISHGIQSSGITGMVQNNGYIYLSTFGGGVYRSSDFGDTWETFKNELTGDIVLDIAALDKILFVSDPYLWRSDDSAKHWHQLVPDTSISKLFVNGKWLMALGKTNRDMALCSSDLGVSWMDITDNLSGKGILPFFVNDIYLFAAVDSEIWRRPLSDFKNSVRNPSPSYLSISLSPNPTTGIITVHSAPANILHVTVSSILGESVIELEHPNAPEFTFNLSKLPPGTYYGRFSLPNEVITRKIMKE